VHLHGYSVPDLPRTNNALEQFFSVHRDHERRTTGRKGTSPASVRSGSVCLVAAVATRLQRFTAEERAPENLHAWHTRRPDLATEPSPHTLRRPCSAT
jgi:hypothetical protein